MTLSTGKQIFTIHFLPNILRSEGNHIMKFVYLVKLYTKYAEKLLQDPFLKIKIDHISGSIF